MSLTHANETFEWRRLGLLLRNDIVTGYRSFLLQAAAIAGLVIVIEIFNMLSANAANNQAPFWWFYAFLVGWGVVVASGGFKELHDRTKNETYLLLPASALEKTVARFLLVTLGFYAFFVVFSTLLALVTQTVDALMIGRQFRWFPRPGDGLLWILFGNLFVVQSVFFLGAAWFRKLHLVKTVLAMFVIGCVLTAFGFALMWLFLPQFRDGLGLSLHGYELDPLFEDHPVFLAAAGSVLQILYFAGIPIFCCFVAWLRVRETQVSHGV